ncbi:MAG: efflux RND transporter periplasmic adaptor subunit [Terriglobia bacterium]
MADEHDRLKELRIDRSSPNARKPGWTLWILVALLLPILALGGWWWRGKRPGASVRTATVRETSGGRSGAVLNASGYVTARRRATVSSKVTGKVVEVLVEEGMRVREGQVLARLDNATPRADLALAEAQLAAARRALAETEVRLHEANLTLGRVRTLAAEGVSSQAELDAAQAEVDSLKARLALGREEVAVAERQVAVRHRDLDDTVIRAPFAGVAISKDAQPGEMISPISAGGGFTRTGICTLVDMTSLEIEVDVNESYIARVKAGQPVEAVLDAYPDWQIAARVITTVPAADRQKATVRVRIAFEQLDPRIFPDMGVKVTFLGLEEAGESRPRLLVPRAALHREAGRDVVYVLHQDRVERRAVRLGAAEGDQVEVVSGLSRGEQVVVEGPDDLGDGDKVIAR